MPPTCTFVVDDFEEEWRFGSSKRFDYIHGRALAGCKCRPVLPHLLVALQSLPWPSLTHSTGVADWPRLFRQAYDHLNPGGWLEFQEYHCCIYSDDGTDSLTPSLIDWVEKMTTAAEKFGRLLPIGDKTGPWMRGAGLADIREDVYKVPIGPWAKDPHLKELGHWYRLQFLEAIEPFTLQLATNVLGWSTIETQLMINSVKKDLKNPRAHLYVKFFFTYGRKPTGSGVA